MHVLVGISLAHSPTDIKAKCCKNLCIPEVSLGKQKLQEPEHWCRDWCPQYFFLGFDYRCFERFLSPFSPCGLDDSLAFFWPLSHAGEQCPICPVNVQFERPYVPKVSHSIRKVFTRPPCLLALLCPVCRVMSGCRKPFEPFCEAFPGDPSYDLIGPFVAPFLPPEFCFIFVLFFFRSASGELRAILL